MVIGNLKGRIYKNNARIAHPFAVALITLGQGRQVGAQIIACPNVRETRLLHDILEILNGQIVLDRVPDEIGSGFPAFYPFLQVVLSWTDGEPFTTGDCGMFVSYLLSTFVCGVDVGIA